jgi:hypothetical protein
MAKTTLEIIEKKFHPDLVYWDAEIKVRRPDGSEETLTREIYDHRQPGDERGASEYVAGEMAAAFGIEDWEFFRA